ncbi:MAG: hypothetical protein HYR72_26515 [Deltaproteobacteria bacterium]|nr:hypothetical protein [Deltaproteobacteria bacterium]MBI3390431.1 hypothetical protein [Deltaproteobacteria bacterium]
MLSTKLTAAVTVILLSLAALASAQVPPFTVSKTVSRTSSPDIDVGCAGTATSIKVRAGTDLVFCYQIIDNRTSGGCLPLSVSDVIDGQSNPVGNSGVCPGSTARFEQGHSVEKTEVDTGVFTVPGFLPLTAQATVFVEDLKAPTLSSAGTGATIALLLALGAFALRRA